MLSMINDWFAENRDELIQVNANVPYAEFGQITYNAINEYYDYDEEKILNNIWGDNLYVVHGDYNLNNGSHVTAYTTEGVEGDIVQIECSENNWRYLNTIDLSERVKDLLVPLTVFFDGVGKKDIVESIYDNLTLYDSAKSYDGSIYVERFYFTQNDIEVYVILEYSGNDSVCIKTYAQNISKKLYYTYGFAVER